MPDFRGDPSVVSLCLFVRKWYLRHKVIGFSYHYPIIANKFIGIFDFADRFYLSKVPHFVNGAANCHFMPVLGRFPGLCRYFSFLMVTVR